MKKHLITLILAANSLIASSQVKNYNTKQIDRWTLESFPLHFYKNAYKITKTNTPMTNRMALYQEVDKYGQAEGLRVEMQQNFNNPHTIYYYKNGVAVYEAHYFANSNQASEIINRNLQGQVDGKQTKRKIQNGKINTVTKAFKNGEDLANASHPQADKINFNSEGLMNGVFFWTAKLPNLSGKLSYQGIAKDGIISELIVRCSLGESYEQFTQSYLLKNQGYFVKYNSTSGESWNETKDIIYLAKKITNSQELALKDPKYIYINEITSYEYGYLVPNYFQKFIDELF